MALVGLSGVGLSTPNVFTRRLTIHSAAEWIVQRGVKTFGVDSPTPDNPASTSYPVHMMCRREHITHYENLANLDRVVDTRFTFVGFPLKLRGAHGGPTRAVAVVD